MRAWAVVALSGLAVAACAGTGPAPAAPDGVTSLRPAEPRLERLSYPGTACGDRDALVYLPAGWRADGERRWPLLVFLHGDGERGDGRQDLDWVLVHGPLYEAWVQRRELPFVIVAPQLPLFGRDLTVDYIRDRDPASIPRRLAAGVPPRPAAFPTPEPMTGAVAAETVPLPPEGPPDGWPRCEADLLTLVELAGERYRADPRRVYLTGLSYGGFGSWHLAARHPDRFAAIAPVAGWGHPELAVPIADRRLPVWAFAGGRDPAVPVRFFYPGLNELERRGHPDVRFTIHEDSGHDVWKRVYAGEDLYAWLLQHQLPD